MIQGARRVSRWHETRGFKLGAGIGAMILTYAGAAWAFAALVNWAGTPPWMFVVCAIPVLSLTVLGAIRLTTVAKLPTLHATGADELERARQGRQTGLLFGVVFTVEVALIALVAVLLAGAGRPLLVPVAIVAIVGVHFLPLARIFRVPTYTITGVLLIVAALWSLVIADEPVRVFTLGLVVALVLWASAAAILEIHLGPPATTRVI